MRATTPPSAAVVRSQDLGRSVATTVPAGVPGVAVARGSGWESMRGATMSGEDQGSSVTTGVAGGVADVTGGSAAAAPQPRATSTTNAAILGTVRSLIRVQARSSSPTELWIALMRTQKLSFRTSTSPRAINRSLT